MSTDLATRIEEDGLIEEVIAQGNLANLSPAQRTRYYGRLCASLDLNPLTRPFEYLTLSGKLVLYARKDATDQLRAKRGVSLTITARETIGDLYVVTARATLPNGRSDEEIGAVPIANLKGELLANAYMKASTKAKRRVTLSICGLGLLDETEVETIPGARVVDDEPAPIGRSGRQALEAVPTVRQRGIAAAMDAEIAEVDAMMAEPIEQTAFEQEQAPGDDPLAFKRGEALQWANQCRAAGIKTADPNPRFTELALDEYIAQHKRMLTNRAPRP